MDDIKTVMTCPLGSECTKIVNNEIRHCVWHITIAGKRPDSEEVIDRKGCAIAWMPLLLVENSQQQRATKSAVESFRNEVAKGNEMNAKVAALITGVDLRTIPAIQNKG